MPYYKAMKTKMNIVPMPRNLEVFDSFCELKNLQIRISNEIFNPLIKLSFLQLNATEADNFSLLEIIKDDSLQEEEYTLKVDTKEIKITASSYNGAYHGLQTLRQLCLDYDNVIPCLYISDKPEFKHRGFMIDCSRHFIPVSELKKLIDMAAMHHLNVFQWHLVDDQGWRLEIPEFPLLKEISSKRIMPEYTHLDYIYEGMYSPEDVQEIQEYANERAMIVVPEIETPGHASALLAAYPELGCTGGPYKVEHRFGIFDDVMCPGNEALFTFLDKVFKYVASVFKGPYIHIGGDECPTVRWTTCEKCQTRIKEEKLKDENELQAYTVTRIANIVSKYNKQPLGWDEVLYGTETLGLPSNLIVMSWQGVKGGLEASRRGFDVIMCPNTQGCYFDYKAIDNENEPGNIGITTLEDALSYSPILPEMDEETKKHVIGGQANLWTEWVVYPAYAEYMLFPRLSATAEVLWNKQSVESFQSRKAALNKRLQKCNIIINTNA